MTKEHDIARGAHAERLLTDEVLLEAFKAVRDSYKEAWIASRPTDIDGREVIYHQLKAVDRVLSTLGGFINTGKVGAQAIHLRNSEQGIN